MTIWDSELWFSEKAENVQRRTWIPWKSKKRAKRAIFKNGYPNIYRNKLSSKRKLKYFRDIFTTLLDAQWRWTLQFLVLEFFGSWLIFALIWWLIAFVHGDLLEENLPGRASANYTPCVLNIKGFHSAFLYSLETQHTTGYGLRVITEECPEAIFILVCQSLIGMTLDSFTISIVFVKLTRSKHATNTIQFSRNAVIYRRDGKLSFMFRVGDLRKSHLVGVNVRAILIKTLRSSEGEILSNFQTELEVKADGGSNSLFLLWPLIVYHEIGDNSALLELTSPELMKKQKIEIIVILNATVESTGVSFEAKSSYLSNEILWGHSFEPMVNYNKTTDSFEIDWNKFDKNRISNTYNFNEEFNSESESTEKNKLINSFYTDDYESADEISIYNNESFVEQKNFPVNEASIRLETINLI